jgi:uncharacterized protein YozE (UPF0346 family)
MFTYFIVNLDCYQIKIGRSRDPKKRFEFLQAATGADLWLLGVIEGDVEKDAHELFANLRVRGEWFRDDQSIRDYLSARSTFYSWLCQQIKRNDVIGDLARDASLDRTFPQQENSYLEIKSYLKHEKNACKEAVLAFAEAFRGWKRVKRRQTIGEYS